MIYECALGGFRFAYTLSETGISIDNHGKKSFIAWNKVRKAAYVAPSSPEAMSKNERTREADAVSLRSILSSWKEGRNMARVVFSYEVNGRIVARSLFVDVRTLEGKSFLEKLKRYLSSVWIGERADTHGAIYAVKGSESTAVMTSIANIFVPFFVSFAVSILLSLVVPQAIVLAYASLVFFVIAFLKVVIEALYFSKAE